MLRSKYTVYGLLLAAVTGFFAPSIAVAAPNSSSYSFAMSSKEAILEHPGDLMIMKSAAWDHPYQRLADRNMPFIELRNDSTSAMPIVRFEMSIGDERFHFSDNWFSAYAKTGASTPGINYTATTQDNENKVVLEFGNGGLQAGQVIRFRIDLDTDANHPEIFDGADYRTILFDMNGRNIYDNTIGASSADNAEIKITYYDTLTDSYSSNSEKLADYDVPVGDSTYFNSSIRPYSLMEGVGIFGGDGSIQGVPEPSSIILMLFCGLGLVGYRRRLSK